MSNDLDDTIAAIATAPGEAALAVVRISGNDALTVADKVYKGRPPLPSQRAANTFMFGRIAASDGAILDDVLFLIMRAPHSFTGEDSVEIQCHGGRLAPLRILRRVLETGARPAEPGEFSKRAFLNRRMDLLQAEAVLDLIKARSERAAAAAVEQLEGALSKKFEEICESLLSLAINIEASLDFPDDELPPIPVSEMAEQAEAAIGQIRAMLGTWDEGHMLREGARIVICGLPNVGKSTLMNTLLEKDRSIVTPIPGTTRDSIEEEFILSGIPIRLIDTAGLRATNCQIEKEGIRRTRMNLDKADLHLYVMDASKSVSEDDKTNLALLNPGKGLIILNKCDLGINTTGSDVKPFRTISTSLTQHIGIKDIKNELNRFFDVMATTRPHAVISERHRLSLVKAKVELDDVSSMMSACYDDDRLVLMASNVRSAIEHICAITGKKYRDEILSGIFSRFCVGK